MELWSKVFIVVYIILVVGYDVYLGFSFPWVLLFNIIYIPIIIHFVKMWIREDRRLAK